MKKFLLLCYFAGALPLAALSQYHYKDTRLLTHPSFEKAQQLLRQGLFKETIPHYEQASQHFQRKGKGFEALFCEVEKAFCLIQGSYYQEAKMLLDSLELRVPAYPLLQARAFEYQAWRCQQQPSPRLDKALWYANRSLQICETNQVIAQFQPRQAARAHLAIAYVLFRKERYIESLKGTEQAEKILRKHPLQYLQALIFHIQGLAYSNEAQSLTKYDQQGHRYNRERGKQLYKQALKLYKQALHPNHPRVGIMWGNLGTAWDMQHDQLKWGLGQKPSDKKQQASNDQNFKPLLDSALHALNQGIRLLEKRPKNARRALVYFCWYKGVALYKVPGAEIQSPKAHQQALNYMVPGMYAKDIFAKPDFTVLQRGAIIGTQLVRILNHKSAIALKYYSKEPVIGKKYLKLAWQICQTMEKLMSNPHFFKVLEEDQLSLSRLNQGFIRRSADCFRYFQTILSSDSLRSVSEYLLNLVEKHKKEGLRKSSELQWMKQRAKVSLIDQKWSQILQRKAWYHARQVALAQPGSLHRIQALDSVSRYRTQLKLFEASLKKRYPTYEKLTGKTTPLRLQEIQSQLKPHQAIVSYTNGLQVAFVITRQRFKVISFTPIEKELEFRQKLRGVNAEFQRMITQTGKSPQFIQQFVQCSHQLYQMIFEPLEKYLPSLISSLLIIPDQREYERIPFEALIYRYNPKNQPQKNIQQYSLVNRYAITYVPSLNNLLLYPQYFSKSVLANRVYTAQFLAPIHFGKSKKVARRRSPILKVFGAQKFQRVAELDSLPFTEQEVKNCQQILLAKNPLAKTRIWTGRSATENRLRQIVGQPTQILHLATHAVSSKRSFELSRLFFYPESSTVDALDGITYYGDILSLDSIKSELVILSACETGQGLSYTGIGLLSLHRAFLQKGVPKILYTQWPVYDEATAILITKFYQHLVKGYTEAKALQLAKKEMLRYYIGSKYQGYATYPPVYWAGFKLTQQVFE
ncbi:MAG TPA: hypothetical protein DCS93_00655 [Microscillaceae bacterium]|nr:hypothetical protein [Microscillaceae bacterium]